MIKRKVNKAKELLLSVVDPFWDWRIGSPNVLERIEKLERDSHPPKDLCEFEQWESLDSRIGKLEEWTHPPVAPGGTTELMELIDNLEKRIKKLEKK